MAFLDRGLCDVFEQRRRDGTVLAGLLDGEQPSVGGAGLGLELVEVVEAALAAEIAGGVDDGLDA